MKSGRRPRFGHTHRFGYDGQAPADDDCDDPSWIACLCGERFRQRCNRCSSARCEPCAKRFVGRLFHVLHSGFECAPGESIVLLTLTAPGQRQHDARKGTPCDCTPPGGIPVGEANAVFGRNFNRLIQDFRRIYDPHLQYARVAEVQARGALHYHVLIRTRAAAAMLADYLDTDPYCPLRQIVIHHEFGHAVDLRAADAKTAHYLVKYASKTAVDRSSIPWLDLSTDTIIVGHDRYRVWTASRGWGRKMCQVRAVQAAWARERAEASESTRESRNRRPRRWRLHGRPEGPSILDHKTQYYTNLLRWTRWLTRKRGNSRAP